MSYLYRLCKTRPAAFDWTKRFFGLPGLNVPMPADVNGAQIGGVARAPFLPAPEVQPGPAILARARLSLPARRRDLPRGLHRRRHPEGRRRFPISSSPEINDNRPEAGFNTVTNYDLALARWVFSAAAELALEAGRSQAAARRRTVPAELPGFELSKRGEPLIARG